MVASSSPRLAVRAVIVHEARLLLVNAWPGVQSDLWCAPGGGVERGTSLPDNLRREVHEECGIGIKIGTPCLINEFHDPASGFHQVEVFFRCTWISGNQDDRWPDPEGVVNRRAWVTREEMGQLRYKPDGLLHAAFGRGLGYDPIETIIS